MEQPAEKVDLGYGVTADVYSVAQVAAMTPEEKVLARIKEVLNMRASGKLPNSQTQLDYAERKLKGAAYAIQNGEPDAAQILAREAILNIQSFIDMFDKELDDAGIGTRVEAELVQAEHSREDEDG